LTPPLPESVTGYQRPEERPQARGPSAGVLSDAIRNVQKYAQREGFANLEGGRNQDFGPHINFDSKGVEFGPWLARFVAQVRRNWFIPMAAMTMRGHVVVTFNVHKDGRITDVTVAKPSSVDAFTLSARNAILASNPTVPLPPEYPDDKAFFTVTFFFNENPGAP
jgi:TonB family protein